MYNITEIGKKAKAAAVRLAIIDTDVKNSALLAMADALCAHSDYILAQNALDIAVAKDNGIKEAMVDRLLLTEKRIADMADGIRQVVRLPDPIGEVLGMVKRPNGLVVGKKRVPLGVIGIIYESRPNVTADAASLCIKAGNVTILRGGSEAINSNIAIASVMQKAGEDNGLPPNTINLVTDTSREVATQMMRLSGYIDVLIPRGGAGLIKTVVENANVPVIETGTGNCHAYIDEYADFDMARSIVINAKVSRPSVCNALESLLVHEKIAENFLPLIIADLKANNVEVRGCGKTRAICGDVTAATQDDWATEYNDCIIAVKVVADMNSAVDHITTYGTKHSETIVTDNYANAQTFLDVVDAAAVYVNASTRFTDGEMFGFGAEIGISTQKIHARGPMGLTDLTSIKYVIYGSGQIRV